MSEISEHAIEAVRRTWGRVLSDEDVKLMYQGTCQTAQSAIDAATAELRAENERLNAKLGRIGKQIADDQKISNKALDSVRIEIEQLQKERNDLRQQVERMWAVVEAFHIIQSAPAEVKVDKRDGTFDPAQREEIRSIAREEISAAMRHEESMRL